MLKKFFFLFFVVILISNAQAPKFSVTGKVVDKDLNQPLEYATIVFKKPGQSQPLAGGITDNKGEFSIEVTVGTYDVFIEFISYKTTQLKQQKISTNTNLGTIGLSEDTQQLAEVEIRAERTSVEMKLDKKVYNVGQDLMVKGGTVSDVLDNVPSISVDAEGTISLRGNENVRVLIDGKPSGLAGINVADALRLLPADAIEKVEVITNPSARYDAEGGAGLINIILKKGKIQGWNGVFTLNTGEPDNHGISANVNYKTKHANFFTTQGLNYRDNPGNFLFDTEYLNPDGSTQRFINERRTTQRIRKSYNGNFGLELFLGKNTSWTNTFTYSRNKGFDYSDVNFFNLNAQGEQTSVRSRRNSGTSPSENREIATNLIHKFKKDGHQLVIDALISDNVDDDFTRIWDSSPLINNQRVFNNRTQKRSFAALDYVLPVGKNSRFEAGYRGDFLENTNDFLAEEFVNNAWTNNTNFSNIFEYKEKVNALYTQFGSKITEKMNFLAGLRWEDSNINVNQLTTNDFNNKRYNNFFPSFFLNYEFSETESATISYSRRIQRPRGRFLNPFSDISSNVNIFRGDPDLDPSLTHAIDFGYLKRYGKLTLNASAYFNHTDQPFQFIRRESGILNEDGVPILFTGPANVGINQRMGFEVTFNYSPFKWWRINNNYNFFRNETRGEFSYLGINDELKSINLDVVAFTWFARLNSKITLPGKVDWQTNITYNAPEKTAQGKTFGIAAMNLAFSKDVLKDKATVAFNISDVFNSRRRIFSAEVPNVLRSYSDVQWRVRQFTLSLTYRFNQKKNEKERQPRRQEMDGGEYMG